MKQSYISPHLEFNKSILPGVEIKRCRKTVHAYKPHLHHELSLGYVIEGQTKLTMNDETICYKTGDGVIIPPMMTHRCAPEDLNHWAYIMLYIDPSYYNDGVTFDYPKRLDGPEAQSLIDFIDILLSEEAVDVIETTLIEMLLAFGQCHETADDQMIDMVHQYIINHYLEDMSLESLQKDFGLNKFSIIRQFKKVYNTTPRAFQIQCKLAKAKLLLAKGESVMDVCMDLNFYDQAHFIREFKKMNGLTPNRYIHQLNR